LLPTNDDNTAPAGGCVFKPTPRDRECKENGRENCVEGRNTEVNRKRKRKTEKRRLGFEERTRAHLLFNQFFSSLSRSSFLCLAPCSQVEKT
jgi:hypothetical protein